MRSKLLVACAALAGMLPAGAAAAPTVSFVAPSSGATLSGNIQQSSACEVRGSRIKSVRFYLGSTSLNTEGSSPWNCNIDTRKFADGAYTLRAVAYDSAGATASTQIGVTIKNSTTTSSNTPPAVSFKAPLTGATLSGALSSSACEALASDSNGIKQVQFYLDGTALNTELSAPYNCSLDTRKFADGAHTLKAVATDGLGAATTAQIGVTIKNSTTTTSPTPTSPYGVYFKTPTANATLSGTVSSSACEVAGTGISKVQFYLDNTALNTEGSAPWNCSIDTKKFADGAHALKAVATYTDGKTGSAQIAVNVKNGSTSSTPSDPVASGCANPSGGYEGFGRNTTGGAGQPVYRVTNLNDSGSGSLRDALSQGNRCVVFDVGGKISLSSNLLVKGANVTIDGLTAPSPGITLSNSTLVMQGSSGARNVVLRGIRVRGTPVGADAIRVYGTSNVVIDRVSASGAGDGALDVTENSRDVTIQWSILGNGGTSHNVSLIKYETARVTVHHNLYINSENRSPHCGRSDTATSLPAEVVCDVRNNLVWNYYKGTEVRTYGTANVVNNYYYTNNTASSAARTIYKAEGGVAYVSGNHSRNGWSVNSSDRSTPFAAVVPTTTDAITAAREVVAKAGARGPRFGLDAADQSYLGQISLD
jgi:hypothetical protein